MKQLVLLVGPQASGKTTFAKQQYPNHFRISQDEMGQKEHWNIYCKQLALGTNLIVDRINHTKEQRAKYISEAKKHGYKTKIIELYESYHTCFMRGVYRQDHPTIKDSTTLKKALQMYFDKYENISYNEADLVVKTKNNPLVLDLTEEFNKGKRFIVVGDLHGCYAELRRMLMEINYAPLTDVVVLCGDLVDRGPEILNCLQFLMFNNNVYSVQGNHDNKFLRWLNMSNVHLESLEETIRQVNHLDLEQLHYDLYNKLHHTIIKFGNNYVTHAGFHPYHHPEHTSKEFSLYARQFDSQLGTFSRTSDKKWYEIDRRYPMFNLFFGHDVHENTPVVNKNIYSADGGAVYGGKLRCFIIDKYKTPDIDTYWVNSGFSIKKEVEWDHMNKFEPYDKLVEQGFLRKQESGDLLLYNYTEATQYQAMWNNYTVECRGLILDKNNGDTIARPFSKFHNLSELITDIELLKNK